MRATPRERQILKTIEQIGQRHGSDKAFQDCIAMMALSMSFMCDFTHREEREKERIGILRQYNAEEQKRFQEVFQLIGEEIEESMEAPVDVLGAIFEQMNLGNGKLGQFFTPGHLARLLGEIQVVEDLPKVQERGWITVCDPCVGSGSLLLGLAAAMTHHKQDHHLKLVATAVDVDIRCVYMAYVQLGLYGIPAVVIHGNSLTLEEWSRWYTPVYQLDNWIWRQTCGLCSKRYHEDEMIKCAQDSMYAIIRYGPDIMGNPEAAKKKVSEEDSQPPEPAHFDIQLDLQEKKNGQMALF